ncbi:DUF6445 family protein [Erythrobacter sanguineus]|uniref:2OG-Fe(II) oxygenase superfamily protein n=1 Tax=Erythrobacter sanguineus TaxID=198312 RepID=A0A1M7S726_9SPHN|nr:DUF6445 family protein [Erythrobacter sanguineus]SHN54142.1 hypothetical protein SAMN02745193_01109 [Erythrobacter sanguineus]
MLPSLIILDNFLKDPWAARRAALALDYDPAAQHGNFPGRNSTAPLDTVALDSAVSRQLGSGLGAAPGSQHGHCRLTRKGDRGKSGVHIDPASYSGILYLSRPEDCAKPDAGGTDFFRHKRTGLEAVPQDPAQIAASGYADANALIEDVVNKDTLAPARWERVLRVPARFNRLLLFSPWQFHNAAPGFGTTHEDARLVMLLFFAPARS